MKGPVISADVLRLNSEAVTYRKNARVLEQKKYHYKFSRTIEPEISVSSGDTVVVKTTDFVDKKITTGKDSKEFELFSVAANPRLDWEGRYSFNPLSGPILVNGADLDDTILIDVINVEVEPGWNRGVTGFSEWWGTLMSNTSPNLLGRVPNIIKVCRIDDLGIHLPIGDGEVLIPPSPFPGTIGTCPGIDVNSNQLGPFGGNMDSPDLIAGSRLYLPVFVEGGLVFVGDCHAAQGDGEFSPSIEIPAYVTMRINLVKGKKINCPRIENQDFIMTVGNARPLEDCIRIAGVEMVSLLVNQYGFDKWDACLLLNLVCKYKINQATSPLYSVSCKFPKKYLPANSS